MEGCERLKEKLSHLNQTLDVIHTLEPANSPSISETRNYFDAASLPSSVSQTKIQSHTSED